MRATDAFWKVKEVSWLARFGGMLAALRRATSAASHLPFVHVLPFGSTGRLPVSPLPNIVAVSACPGVAGQHRVARFPLRVPRVRRGGRRAPASGISRQLALDAVCRARHRHGGGCHLCALGRLAGARRLGLAGLGAARAGCLHGPTAMGMAMLRAATGPAGKRPVRGAMTPLDVVFGVARTHE